MFLGLMESNDNSPLLDCASMVGISVAHGSEDDAGKWAGRRLKGSVPRTSCQQRPPLASQRLQPYPPLDARRAQQLDAEPHSTASTRRRPGRRDEQANRRGHEADLAPKIHSHGVALGPLPPQQTRVPVLAAVISPTSVDEVNFSKNRAAPRSKAPFTAPKGRARLRCNTEDGQTDVWRNPSNKANSKSKAKMWACFFGQFSSELCTFCGALSILELRVSTIIPFAHCY